jgi:hypothetical protein
LLAASDPGERPASGKLESATRSELDRLLSAQAGGMSHSKSALKAHAAIGGDRVAISQNIAL